jgi:hypothetical protein
MESISKLMARRIHVLKTWEIIFLYLLMGVYALAISWYYNHSVFYAVIDYLGWPVYLAKEQLWGRLSHGMWKIICESYFI